MLRRWFWKS